MRMTKELEVVADLYVSALIDSEIVKEKVEEVSRDVLKRSSWKHETRHQRIIDPKDVWLMSEQDLKFYLIELRKAFERARLSVRADHGQPYHVFHCPSQLANDRVTRIKFALAHAAVKAAGQEMNGSDLSKKIKLLGASRYDQFIAGVVKFVIRNRKAPRYRETIREIQDAKPARIRAPLMCPA